MNTRHIPEMKLVTFSPPPPSVPPIFPWTPNANNSCLTHYKFGQILCIEAVPTKILKYSKCLNNLLKLRLPLPPPPPPPKKPYCRFSHDVTKIQTAKLLILLIFYFHDTEQQLKTNIHTNFCSEWVLGFVIDYAWISKLLRDAAFTWRPRELSCWSKKGLISGNFGYLNSSCIWKSIILMIWVLREINSQTLQLVFGHHVGAHPDGHNMASLYKSL